jgi:hypothetical protein
MIEPEQNSTTPASNVVPPAKANAEAEAAAKARNTNRRYWLVLAGIAAVCVLLAWVLRLVVSPAEELFSGASAAWKNDKKFVPLTEGTWRFIVSGDSRNCGDVVVPAIASDVLAKYQPSFYWHLGDLRAIYKVDEDMAYAALANGQYLGCENYLKQAWPDFIHHQIAPFGSTPYYLGIGNHEVIWPKGYSREDPRSTQPKVNSAQFTSQFAEWLLAPAIKEQRLKDKDCDNPPANSIKAGQQAPMPECQILPRNYYHWIQGGVDFIYLDNASNVFGDDQITWLKETLASARKNDEVRSIVVGMHEALPESLSADHAMCDTNHKPGKAPPHDPYPYKQSCDDGQTVYNELVDFQSAGPKRNVYVLASHSHFYMQGIFNIDAWPQTRRLQGWIAGTAGAVRYPLPKDARGKPGDERTNVYGYLLGTVDQNGKIEFKFQEVKAADVPSRVSQEFTPRLVNWCFAHNSEDIDPHALETTTRCPGPPPPPPSPSPKQ